MEPALSAIAYIFAYIFIAPIAAKAVMLDAKLDPEPGEDESRLALLQLGQLKTEKKQRLSRSFCRRWLRAANYREENIERAIAGRPVDNCPRLTRAKRNLWRTLKDDHAKAAARKASWRETGDNHQNELAIQHAGREIQAEANYHQNVTIDNIECERAIIAADGEGKDAGPETVIETIVDGKLVHWPDHGTILLGAGGVGFKNGDMSNPVDLPPHWLGHDDKRFLDGIEAIEFYLSLPDRYGPLCYFVMFSFNYDVTMLLKGLRQGRSNSWHYDRVWEICKRKDKKTGLVLNNTIYIGDYAISYIKSKVLVIHKLDKEPDENGHYPVLKRVTLYDVFGFYQTSFVEVVASLVPLGLATEEEVERMRQNKARRGDFAHKDWPLDRWRGQSQRRHDAQVQGHAALQGIDEKV